MNFQGQLSPKNITSFLTRLGRYKLPLSNSVFASRTELDVFLFPVGDVSQQNATILRMRDVDPDFANFEDIPFWQGEIIGLTPNGSHVLIPYRKIVNGIARNNPSFLFLNVALEQGRVVIRESRILNEEIRDYFVDTGSIASFGNFFLVKVEGTTFKVNFSGQFEQISNMNTKATVLGNQVYFMLENRETNRLMVYRADINGNNRTLVGEDRLSIETLSASFGVIDGHIIGYSGNNLFRLNLSNNQVKIEMLNNEGIRGAISSIQQVGDEVFITVIREGTGGAFKKPLKDFFEILK
ncbi:hypothetical protein BC751_4095 [Cecembia calidifontis]|uniref:Uncharacterized protein n=1 Tax=Cecembia calidifontis TaxID=1187080 RepID=A0A4Q7PFI8_9BACT|nr:hypothetical protein BC751_4095 [Cecembia calidifontis]